MRGLKRYLQGMETNNVNGLEWRAGLREKFLVLETHGRGDPKPTTEAL